MATSKIRLDSNFLDSNLFQVGFLWIHWRIPVLCESRVELDQ
jgi:hypothetical protein